MAFGDLKVQDLIYEDSSNNEITVVIADLATKANPVFSGTVTVPTATAGDNSTKAASTAFVVASFAPKNAPAFTGSATGVNLTLSGNLTVNGTQTIINTQTLDVEDKQIEIGKVSSPSDTTADQGGIKLKGATDKTFLWVNSTDAWTSSEHIHLGDNKKLLVGTGSDLSIYHDGSNSLINASGTGSLIVQGADDIFIRPQDGEEGIKVIGNGAVILYHDNSTRVTTTAAGVEIGGNLSTASASNFIINAGGTSGTAANFLARCGSENAIVATANGSVDLYHDNAKKLETTSSGINVTGAINVNGSALASGNTVDLVADGAIAAGKPVIIKSNGKVSAIVESGSARSTVQASSLVGDIATDTNLIEVQTVWMEQHRMLTVIWTNSGNDNLYARTYKFDSSWNVTTGSIQTLSSNTCRSIQSSYDTQQDRVMVACVVVRSGNYHLEAMVGTPSTSNTNIGSWTNFVSNRIVTGSGNTAEALALFYETTSQKHVFIYRKNPSSGAPGSDWDTYSRVISLSGDTFTINSETTLDADDMTQVDICRVDGSKVAVSMRMNSGSSSGTGYARIGTIGSTTMTWGSRVDFTGGGSSVISYDPERATSIIYDTANSKLFVGWIHASNKRAYSVVGSVSGTTLSMDTSTWLDIAGGANGNSESWMRLVRDPFGGGIYTYWTKGNANDRVYAAKVTYDNSAAAKSTLGSSTDLNSSINNMNRNKNISATGDGYVFLAANKSSVNDSFHAFRTKVADTATNITLNNFLGFAASAINDTATGTINLPGNTVDNQSGLSAGTRYFINDDGTLTTTGSPSVVNSHGGLLAVSATKGVVIGQGGFT